MSSKTAFLVNPASAAGTTGRRWPELSRLAARLGLEGDAYLSERPGQLGALARQALADGASRLVVVGGDGSINEVANGIAGRDGVELGIIPRGTGWDFARSLGIPHDVRDAVEVARDGRARAIDLGRASFRSWAGAEETAYFANVASAGMSGAVARRANNTPKALGGKASYLWATLAVFARWRNGELTVTVDDERRSAIMSDVIVANGPYLGGGMKMCPQASLDDGLLDVLLIGDVTKRDLALTLPKIYRGTHLPHPKAELLRGASVSVEASERMPIQLDGEQPGTTPARFGVVPGVLRVRVP